jgi:hypothetical protein
VQQQQAKNVEQYLLGYAAHGLRQHAASLSISSTSEHAVVVW